MLFNRYKKVDLYSKFTIIENFFNDVDTCTLYKSEENILKNKSEEECIVSSGKVDILGKRVFIGNRSFDLSGVTSDIQAYIKNDIIIKMKRGYEPGVYTYFRVVKDI